MLDWSVADFLVGRHPLRKRSSIDEWLERRADRAVRFDGAVKFALTVIASAYQRADSTAAIIHRHHRAL